MTLDDATAARARSFEVGAEAYDELRPGYPEALVDDVLAYAALLPGARVLDVGAGTGKATVALARRGIEVTAVDPSAAMARRLEQRAQQERVGDRVDVRVAAFEDLDGTDGPFALVVAAQSWHWTDPDSRWQRLLDLLAPSGAVALFWNRWHLDPAVHEPARVAAVYDRVAPGLVPDLPRPEDDARPASDGWPADEIEATSGLVDPAYRCYDWLWTLDTPAYLGLLATTSQYAVSTERVRRELFDALGEVLGPQVRLVATTHLYLARRA